MCLIYHLFELIWSAESGRNTKEIRNVVAERAIIRVFHYTHNLYNIVSELYYFWYNYIFKLCEGVNFLLSTTHANVRLVNP